MTRKEWKIILIIFFIPIVAVTIGLALGGTFDFKSP